MLRRGLDDVFWNEKIPELLAQKKKIPFREAQQFVIEEYDKVGRTDARWYVPEYWLDLFTLDPTLDSILTSVDYAGGIYEDVRLIQEFAKKYMIVITTNNPRSLLEHKLRGFKYAENISSTFSSISDFGKIVKNRNFYTQVCKELGTKPEYILHVGDDPFYDVIEPRAVGISALLIDRDGKDGTLHNLYDLRVMLQNH